ncbi:MAG: CPBP family intramembrane metalloprotease [Treponema sp.]|nr:CPBP family intramembrane metalloprotease [Treponema sp.]
MKRHTLLSEIPIFLIIFFLFIVRSFFTPKPSSGQLLFQNWDFPYYQIALAALSSALLFFYYEKSKHRTLVIFPVLFTFGMLFSTSLFCRFLLSITNNPETLSIVKPQGLFQWFNCLLNFFCAAFFEEVIFRFYFSDKLCQLLSLKLKADSKMILKKGVLIFCELCGLLCFAFAHIYLGWISVLNAAIAHVFLRLCFKKTQKLWPCVASHFLYNVISLILL